jgi:hypothetical protein
MSQTTGNTQKRRESRNDFKNWRESRNNFKNRVSGKRASLSVKLISSLSRHKRREQVKCDVREKGCLERSFLWYNEIFGLWRKQSSDSHLHHEKTSLTQHLIPCFTSMIAITKKEKVWDSEAKVASIQQWEWERGWEIARNLTTFDMTGDHHKRPEFDEGLWLQLQDIMTCLPLFFLQTRKSRRRPKATEFLDAKMNPPSFSVKLDHTRSGIQEKEIQCCKYPWKIERFFSCRIEASLARHLHVLCITILESRHLRVSSSVTPTVAIVIKKWHSSLNKRKLRKTTLERWRRHSLSVIVWHNKTTKMMEGITSRGDSRVCSE